jgi:hypothetical protein
MTAMHTNPRTILGQAATGVGALALFLSVACDASPAAGVTAPYPSMAPLAQYLSPSRADEISLARSAAPPTISRDAQILALGPKGYETAAAGKNGFVCLVERAWANNYDRADFWNPRVRAPHCFNAAAARSVLPAYQKRTEWVLSGASKAQMQARTEAALAAHGIPAPEVGSMAYMMSKDSYLGDEAGGHWYPHLMFYLPRTAPAAWGANLSGSPVFSDAGALEPLTIFFVPVTRWSDGTPPDSSTH